MDHQYSFHDNGKQLYGLLQHILRLSHKILGRD